MKKQASREKAPVTNLQDPISKGDQDRKWDDFWEQLPTSTSTKDDDAWEKAVETAEQQNPNEIIEGQRFQGQGE